MFIFIFKNQKNTLNEQIYTANQVPERRAFIKSIYQNLTDKIDRATENLIDDDLSDPAKAVFNNMIKLLENQRDFIKMNGRFFIDNGFVNCEPSHKFDLIVMTKQ